MKKVELIDMLNRDLADEHAAILRYLVHAYEEGENTPLGANLLSRSREEMWHMHWLGLIIAGLGGEPAMKPNPYPYDPTNRGTVFQSYVDYELKLIPHYYGEADKVDDPQIKRVLQREAWESKIHADKFRRTLGKMKPDVAASLPSNERELPAGFLDRLQEEVSAKYVEMIQHARSAWVLQKEGIVAWRMMDQSMEKMKQLGHLAEVVAENGLPLKLSPWTIDPKVDRKSVLEKALSDVSAAKKRHEALRNDPELVKNAGMVINMELTLQQEDFNQGEIENWLKDAK